MGYLPSKNFIALIFGALVLIFAGWLSVWIWNTPTSQFQNSKLKTQTSFLAAYKDASRDSDNDGLKDWEEILWKTNINNPDTDGDGAPDGEEVKLARDPLVKGPDDKLKPPEEAQKSGGAPPKTLTEKIAQQFSAQYLTALGSSPGGGVDNFRQKTIAESLIKSLAGDAITFQDKYSGADISTQENAGGAFIRSYLNAAGGFLDKNFLELKEPEVVILDRAMSSGDFKELATLSGHAKAYQRAAEFFKKQKVPVGYTAIHVELMNILNNTSVAASYMQATEADPAKGLIGLSLYFEQAERVPAVSKSIQQKIKSDGIDFAPSEGGYHFIKYNL